MTEKHQPKYPKPRFPPISQQTKNFIESMKDYVEKPGIVEQDQYTRRRGICDGCEYLDPRQNRCTKCGCLLMAKLRAKSARCPIGKW